MEGILTKMRGSYGTHYIGPLWHIDGPKAGGILGFRWLPKEQEPVHMEIITLDKYFIGNGDASFPDIGTTSYTVIIKGKDRLQFQGMWLDKIPTDPNEANTLRSRFKDSK